jgi:hypothetical protein
LKSEEYSEQDMDLIYEERRIPWTGVIDNKQ